MYYGHTNHQQSSTPHRRRQAVRGGNLNTPSASYSGDVRSASGQERGLSTPIVTNQQQQNHQNRNFGPPSYQDGFAESFDGGTSSYMSSVGTREFDMQQTGLLNNVLPAQLGITLQPTVESYVIDSRPIYFKDAARLIARFTIADPSLGADEACLSLESLNDLDDSSDFKKQVQLCYVLNLDRLMAAQKAKNKTTERDLQTTDYYPFCTKMDHYQIATNRDIRNIDNTIEKLRAQLKTYDQQTRSSTAQFGGATRQQNAEAVFMEAIGGCLQSKIDDLVGDRQKAVRSVQTVEKLHKFIEHRQEGTQTPVQVAELFSTFGLPKNHFHLDLSGETQEKIFLEPLETMKLKMIDLNSKVTVENDHGTMNIDNDGSNRSVVDELGRMYSANFPPFRHDLKEDVHDLLYRETWKMLHDMMTHEGQFDKLFNLVMEKARGSDLLHPDFSFDMYAYHNQYSSDWAQVYIAILFGSDDATHERDGESGGLYLVRPSASISGHNSIWYKDTSADDHLTNLFENVHISSS